MGRWDSVLPTGTNSWRPEEYRDFVQRQDLVSHMAYIIYIISYKRAATGRPYKLLP